MGDRVRVRNTYDPFGYVQAWLDKVETAALAADLPRTGDSYEQLVDQHQEYDGIYCCWKAAQLLATSNPTLSTALLDHSILMMQNYYDGYATLRLGPTEPESGSATGIFGYWLYNLGPRVLYLDTSIDAGVRSDAGTMAANYARHGQFAKTSDDPLWAELNGLDSWISSETVQDAAKATPVWAREWALATLCHLVVDSDFGSFESRTRDPWGLTWLHGHDEWLPRMISTCFLSVNEPGNVYNGGLIDYWEDIAADLAAVDGDWTQVPECWSVAPATSYGFSAFEFLHTARTLIYYYEDDLDDTFNTAIETDVLQMCDWCLDYMQRPTAAGSNSIVYRIPDQGEETNSHPDFALRAMPMMAWAYKQTGEHKYYKMAAELAYVGVYESAWLWGKWFNTNTYWAYDGFQWLGWVPTQFSVFWK